MSQSSFKRSRTASFDYGMSQLSGNTGLIRKRSIRPKAVVSRRRASAGKLTAAKVRTIARGVIYDQQETKYFDSYAANKVVSQTNQNASGHSIITLGLTPAQGTSASERVGDAIIGETLTINSQYTGQKAYGGATICKSYCVMFKGSSPVADMGNFMDPNTWIQGANFGVEVYDNGSFRNPDFLDSVKVLGSWTTKIPYDGALAVNGVSMVNATQQVVIPLKGLRMEYDAASGQHSNLIIAVITVANGGNQSVTAGTLNNVVTNVANTGILFSQSSRLTYRDA